MNLNLSSNFKPLAGPEIDFQSFSFSGGEPHIKIQNDWDKQQPVNVSLRINSFNDFGLLCMAVDALKRMEAKLGQLIIPYFPAARQDRLMQAGEPLSVKVYADIINQFGFQKVLVFDAHSEVTPAVLNNCQVITNHQFIAEVLNKIPSQALLISPDGGALKKIYKCSEFLGGLPVVECSKSRDVKTGQLSGFKVYADDLQGQDCLVVDDICDAGGTFVGLAQALKVKNAGNLYLAVSHGIFSKGFEELLKHFTHIFCTDSVKDFELEGLTQIKLTHGLLP
jgi:ribose-phosphate pyrophosphokinase